MSRAGAAAVDITPTEPIMQGGFGQRTTPSEGVLDPIMAKALYLETDDARLVLITADLIAIPGPLSDAVNRELATRLGLTPDQICLCASHTHSGPIPLDPAGAPTAVTYTRRLELALVDVAVAAHERARPCRVATATGAVEEFFNRRTRGNPNHVDERVAVLSVHDADDDSPLAVVFGVGCHPVTLGWDNMLLSGDFPGVAQRTLESEHGIPHALFFNTTEGNVIPTSSPNRNSLDPRGYHGGSYADTERLGRVIADEVVRVVTGLEHHGLARLGSRRHDLAIAPKNAAFDLESSQARLDRATQLLRQELGDDFVERAAGHVWALASHHVIATDADEPTMRRLMIAVCEYLGLSARVSYGRDLGPVNVPVQVLEIDDLPLLALPGEVLVEVGDEWQRRAGSERAFVVGLANGHLRYLPRAAHFAEPDADQHYETVTAGLEPNGVESALDTATGLLAQLRAV